MTQALLAAGGLGVTFTRLGVVFAIVFGKVLIVNLPLVSRALRRAPAEAIRLTG